MYTIVKGGNALSGRTIASYGYRPELDVVLGRLESIAKQYAPGGGLTKTLTMAQESNLQQGKRKSMSNIAQQLVSAGLANTTNLPSAELGYEAEVMAPARTQLNAEIAKMYMDTQMAIAQYMGQQESQANQMRYGAVQSALQRAAQYGGSTRTPFMGSQATQPFSEGIGGPAWSYPTGDGTTTGGGGGYTPSPAYTRPTDTLLLPQPNKIESALRYAPGYGYGAGIAPVPTYSLLGEQGGIFKGAGYTGTWNEPGYTTPGGGTATMSDWKKAQANLKKMYP